MKAVIMQPTYLPWLGYFDLIDQADVFVFLDTVQFEKQSWQQRNKIRTSEGLEWITVPVLIKGRFGQLIRDVEINPVAFPEKHIKQIKQHYGRAPYFHKYFDELADLLIMSSKDLSLNNLNIELIQWACSKLSLSPVFYRSSDLGVTGKRTELLVNVLKAIKATQYLSPLSSWDYLKNDHCQMSSHNIALGFHNYAHPEYRQVYDPFIPFVSIIDLVFNEGERSAAVIRSGRREEFRPDALVIK